MVYPVAVGEKQKLFAISVGYRSLREGSLAGNNATLRYTLDPEDIHRSRSTAGSATFVSHRGQQSFAPLYSLFPRVFFPPSFSLSLSLRASFSPSVRCSLFFRRQVRKSWRDQRRESIVGYRHQIFYEFRGGFVRSTNARQGKRENFRIKFLPPNFTPRST